MNSSCNRIVGCLIADDEDESDALSSSLPPSGKNVTGVTSEEDDSLAHGLLELKFFLQYLNDLSGSQISIRDNCTSIVFCV